MNSFTLAARNVTRDKLRTALTIVGIALAVFFFVAMRTMVASWENGEKYADSERIATRHKVTFIMPLPKRYAEDIRAVPEIASATFLNWFGAKDPSHPNDFYATMAVDSESFLEVYKELEVPADQRQAWLENRQGAIIGDNLAKNLGYKVGDKVVLSGTIYPGQWEFIVEGIYTTKSKVFDRNSFWFHWDYLNESLSEQEKDRIGWVASRVKGGADAATVAQTIDGIFDERDVQTLTQSEQAMQKSFMGMLAAVLEVFDIVSAAILVIFMLILGNTIAMSVRERTSEYGCMRAVGFSGGQIGRFVIFEALFLGLLGGGLGLGAAVASINGVLGPVIEENIGAMFPYFRVDSGLIGVSLLLAAVLAVAGALIPAIQASRLDVIDSLRKVD